MENKNERPLSYNEWVKELNVSRGYIEPTPYFKGNEFDTRKFTGQNPIKEVSWQNLIKMPFRILMNIGGIIW